MNVWCAAKTSLFKEILLYIEQGGFVGWPLMIGAVLLWFGLGYRLFLLRRGGSHSLEAMLKRAIKNPGRAPSTLLEEAVSVGVWVKASGVKNPRPYLDELFLVYEQRLERFAVLVSVIVMVAPLAGLLGTVSGMIETFDALGSMELFSQSGGIAGGISQALISTQMGLAVAIPGLLVGRLLRRRQVERGLELEQLKEMIVLRDVREFLPIRHSVLEG